MRLLYIISAMIAQIVVKKLIKVKKGIKIRRNISKPPQGGQNLPSQLILYSPSLTISPPSSTSKADGEVAEVDNKEAV